MDTMKLTELYISIQNLIDEQKETNRQLRELNKGVSFIIQKSTEINISGAAGQLADKAFGFLQGLRK